MTQDHPVVARYLDSLEASLRHVDAPELSEISGEIRSHIAEARASGTPVDDILESLGPADRLARAYAVELLLNPRGQRRHAIMRRLRVWGVVAATSIATFFVVIILGTIGISFGATGVAVFVIGALEASEIHLPGVQMNGVSPIVAMMLGPVCLVVGVAAWAGLVLYIRFLMRTLKKLMPPDTPVIGRTVSSAGACPAPVSR